MQKSQHALVRRIGISGFGQLEKSYISNCLMLDALAEKGARTDQIFVDNRYQVIYQQKPLKSLSAPH
jgi:hypothetical protein